MSREENTPMADGEFRVLLIHPPMRYYPMSPRSLMTPLSLLSLASVLRDEYPVAILDAAAEGFEHVAPYDAHALYFGLPVARVVEKAIASKPSVVGISCPYSICFPLVADLCRGIKRAMPDVRIVLGGTHASYLPREIMEAEPSVDFIVLGEAERSFPELVRRLDRGENPSAIDGLAYRVGGGVRANPKTEFIADLDSLPFPSWDLISLDRYTRNCIIAQFFTRTKGRHASIITTRGCPHRCTFCISTKYWGNKYRQRSAENVLAEMEMLISRLGVRRFLFLDDNFLVSRRRGLDIMQGIIDRNWRIEWCLPNGIGVWHLDEEVVSLMKRSGLSVTSLSLESCSPGIRERYVKKPVDLDRTRRAISLLDDYDIAYFINFIMGFPDETKKTIEDSLAFLRKLRSASVLFNMASPFPGTELYEICRDAGCLSPEFDFTALNFSRSFIDTRDFSAEEITNYVQRKQVLFNLGLLWRDPRRFISRYLPMLTDRLMLEELARIHWHRYRGIR